MVLVNLFCAVFGCPALRWRDTCSLRDAIGCLVRFDEKCGSRLHAFDIYIVVGIKEAHYCRTSVEAKIQCRQLRPVPDQLYHPFHRCRIVFRELRWPVSGRRFRRE